MPMKRFHVPEKDNTAYPKRASSGGRPGVGKDGEAGVAVQVILPKETAEALDRWAAENNMGRGPAARRIIGEFVAPASDTYLTVVCRLCGTRITVDAAAEKVVNVPVYCSRPACIAADNARYLALKAERDRI